MSAWQAIGKAHDALAQAVLDTVVFLLGAVVVVVLLAVLGAAALVWAAGFLVILALAVVETAWNVARLGWKSGPVGTRRRG